MYEAYIFGAGQEYDRIVNLLAFQQDLKIKGIITSKPYPYSKVDGYSMFVLEDVVFEAEDYVILAVGDGWQSAMRLAAEYIDISRIIRSKVFLMPGFNLKDYLKLKESRCSILSNFCLGGIVSDQLGLEFLSPTINMVCLGENFIRFANNYDKYLSMEMKPHVDETYIPDTRGIETFMGKGIVGDVVWLFRHSNNPILDIKKWNERKGRVNRENIAVMMVLFTRDEVEQFEKIPIKKKLGLFYEKTDYEDVLYIPGWDDMNNRYENEFRWAGYAQKYVLYPVKHVPPVNWIKFLNGEEYLRVSAEDIG